MTESKAKETGGAPKRDANEHGDPNVPGAGGAPSSGGPSAGGTGKELDTPASGNVPTDKRLDAQRDAEGNIDEGHQIPEYQRLTDREKELVKGGLSFAQAQEQALNEQHARLASGEGGGEKLSSRAPDRLNTI
jgi:hypothetical protein